MKRRTALFSLLSVACSIGASWSRVTRAASVTSPPKRIVVLDWGLTEILLSIGVVPVGAANTKGFAHNYPACTVPASVVDLGLMFQPNLEVMLTLRPDLILITPAHAALRGTLERIAPTVTMGLYRSSETPYTAMRAETLQLAGRLGVTANAQAMLEQTDAVIATTRAALSQRPETARDTPLYLVHFLDESRLRVYGPHSWYGELLTQIGIRNAWPGTTHGRAYLTTGIDTLADDTHATLAYVSPLSPLAANMMQTSPVWRATPYAQPGRTVALPEVPTDAGLLSAMAFAHAVGGAFAGPAAPPSAAIDITRREAA